MIGFCKKSVLDCTLQVFRSRMRFGCDMRLNFEEWRKLDIARMGWDCGNEIYYRILKNGGKVDL